MNKVTIEINYEQLVQACVAHILDQGGSVNEDGEAVPSLVRSVRSAVDAEIKKSVRSAVQEMVQKELDARVRVLVEEQLAGGFPIYDLYGQVIRHEPFDIFVRRSLEQMFDQQSNRSSRTVGAEIARDAFSKHIEKAMKDEMELLRDKIRQSVNEKLSADVVKTLRDAIGLR